MGIHVNVEKKLIHMDQTKYKVWAQIALEDDRNLQDNKPDIAYVLAQKSSVKLDELRPLADHVSVKGKLLYEMLYQSDEQEKICQMSGEIPFEEQVYMEGVKPEDMVLTKWNLEDVTIGMINSRKLSIQALISLTLWVEELYDEELPIAISDAENIQKKYKTLDIAGITTMKKDIFRIREELELPQQFPNIGALIWYDLTITELEFKASLDKIFIKGEIRAFFLYEASGDGGSVYAYSTTIPVSGSIECQGCQEYMMPDISYTVSSQDVEVHHDFDGEDRNIGVEMVLDLQIKLYQEDKIDILDDCYSTGIPLEIVRKNAEYKTMLIRHAGKCKVQDSVKDAAIPENCKIISGSGVIQKESEQLSDEGVDMIGMVDACFLLRDEETGRFYRLHHNLPFHYLLESPGLGEGGICSMNSYLEQLSAASTGDGWEIRGILNFDVAAFQTAKEELITEMFAKQTPLEKEKRIPSMIGYIVKNGDSLWDVGKKFMVSQEDLKEVNHLSRDEVKRGDKLLIIRQS